MLERPEETTEVQPGEEYYQWIDLLSAAVEAGETFTYLEMGAGWGRWASRAAAAARILGKTPRVGMAEAEPQHIAWVHEHMADNNITSYRLYEAAVGGSAGTALFMVQMPADEMPEINNNRDWYGQGLCWHTIPGEIVGEYYGRPLVGLFGGWRGIEVPQVTLSSILADYDFVDIIDFDTQGSEADCIEEAIGSLNIKVRRLHIGTHSPEVEARIERTLLDAGWICSVNFGCLQAHDTPHGRFEFTDGVQSWRNPRLS